MNAAAGCGSIGCNGYSCRHGCRGGPSRGVSWQQHHRRCQAVRLPPTLVEGIAFTKRSCRAALVRGRSANTGPSVGSHLALSRGKPDGAGAAPVAGGGLTGGAPHFCGRLMPHSSGGPGHGSSRRSLGCSSPCVDGPRCGCLGRGRPGPAGRRGRRCRLGRRRGARSAGGFTLGQLLLQPPLDFLKVSINILRQSLAILPDLPQL